MNTPIMSENFQSNSTKKQFTFYSKVRSKNFGFINQNYSAIQYASSWYQRPSRSPIVTQIPTSYTKDLFTDLLTFAGHWLVIIPNIGRMLSQQREQCISLIENAYSYKVTPFTIVEQLVPSRNQLFQAITKPDAKYKDFFTPSKTLARLVFNKMNKPDKQTINSLNRMYWDLGSQGIRKVSIDDVSENISRHIEGILSTIAGRMINGEELVQISKDNRFTPELCSQINENLELDPYDPRPVHDLLYSELVDFALNTGLKRPWGELFYDTSTQTVKLKINPENIPSPDINLIDDEAWIVT